MNDLRVPRPESCGATPQDRSNKFRVLLWSVGWALMIIVASLAATENWIGGHKLALLLAVLSIAMGLGCVAAHVRFLRETDELQRQIHLEALAVAFGVGIVGGMGALQIGRALDLGEPSFSYIMAGMLFVYSFATIATGRRYR